MSKIWITSDLHFNHDKDFIYKPRGFSSVEEMNKILIDNFNEVVDWDDNVYILGDCGLGSDLASLRNLLKKLNGKLHIILGNHDTTSRIEMYSKLPNVVEVQWAKRLKYNGYTFWLSHFPALCSNEDSHKPLKVRTINLCGHYHTADPFADKINGLIYHCEVDAHDNYPVLLDDILNDIRLEFAFHKED